MMRVDIGCDMGEGYGVYSVALDEDAMKLVSSAHIACGFHAGDYTIMHKTVQIAKSNNVSVGAHPGYPDLQGFGRRFIEYDNEEIQNILIYQIGALMAFTKAEGIELQHVKPHGALYTAAVKNEDIAKVICETIFSIDKNLILVALEGSEMVNAATKVGLKVAREGFADRAYNNDGSLVNRKIPGAVIHDPQTAAERAVSIVKNKSINSIDGKKISLEIDTLCVHGDTPSSLKIIEHIKGSLCDNGLEIAPLKKVIS